MKAIDRKLARLSESKKDLHEQMAAHDQSDYEGLANFGRRAQEIQDEIDELEMRWLELSDVVG